MGNLQAKRYDLKISKYEDWANSLERASILGEIVKLEKIKPEAKKNDSVGENNILKRAALKKAYIEKSKWLTEKQIDEELKEIDADLKDPELDKGIEKLLRETREELLRHKQMYKDKKAAAPSPDRRGQRRNIERALILKAKIQSLEQQLEQALEKADTYRYDYIRLQLDKLRSELSGIERPRREHPLEEYEVDGETQYESQLLYKTNLRF